MLIKNSAFAVCISFLIFFLIAGCSSDEENPITPTPPQTPPDFSLQEITLPQNMLHSTNTLAKQAITTIDEAIDFARCGCTFEAPDEATLEKAEGGEWEYTWSVVDLTKTMQITAVSGRYTWKIFYDGTQTGQEYNNWRYMDAVQSTDLSSGHVTLFKAGTVTTELEWVWYTLENTDYKLIKQYYGDPSYKVEITIKTDNSGKIDKFKRNSSGSMVFDVKYAWTSDGSGSCWTFEDGVQTSFNTWQ
jgi:hypothetical protein